MIVTQPKPPAELAALLKGKRKLFLVGCGECATLCQTGGEKEVAALRAQLARDGFVITGELVIEAPCDERQTRRDLAAIRVAAADADALLVLACGAGCQVVGDVSGQTALPALNTVALAKIKRINHYEAYCVQCGECVLGLTAGICPVTRCSKGLRNGPCGGAHAGKCEVEADRDCAWHLILTALTPEQQARLAGLQPLHDHRRKKLAADRK